MSDRSTESGRGMLERQLNELKGRVSLIFLLAGTVAAQLILRLLG